MADRIDPAAVLAAWPDHDAVRQAPELAVEQIHELVALIEESGARHAETRILLARRAAECRRAEEQRDQETAWNLRRTEEFTATLAQTVAAAEAEMLLAVVEARKAALLEAADELDRFAAKPTGRAAIDFLRARADAQGSTPKPSPIGLDLDAVRNGHVPWPGDSDDGTCSCCGMPHPCVTRRLADQLEDARAEVERLTCACGTGPYCEAEVRALRDALDAARAELAAELARPPAEQYNAEVVRRLGAEAAVADLTAAGSSLERIASQAWADSQAWFPSVHAAGDLRFLHHVVLGMVGEAGEVANLVKKANRLAQAPYAGDLAAELADVLVYLLHIATISGIDLAQAYEAKRQINIARWGDPDTLERTDAAIQATVGGAE